MYRYFKRNANVGSSEYIYYWKPKRFSNENITAPSAPNNFLNPSLEYLGTKLRVRFSWSKKQLYTVTGNQ